MPSCSSASSASATTTEPLGAQGLPLTPLRSIAVDKALHVYGTPFFIQADLPVDSPTAKNPFAHLMIAQDTGSAIVGPARADLYWGAGKLAGQIAGRLKDHGQFTMLVPREIDPAEAGAKMPLPLAAAGRPDRAPAAAEARAARTHRRTRRHAQAQTQAVSRRELSEEERALWRGVARSLKPLRKRAPRATEDGEAVVAAPKPVEATKATARTSAKADKAQKADEDCQAHPAAHRDPPIIKLVAPPPSFAPIARREKQHLARGRTAIDARIDLHGMTQAEAHAALAHFLRRAQRDGAKFALVVTGKGTRSAAGERGVLRRQVPLWLRLPELRDIVLGFEEAHVSHGGEGALYVRLRRGCDLKPLQETLSAS